VGCVGMASPHVSKYRAYQSSSSVLHRSTISSAISSVDEMPNSLAGNPKMTSLVLRTGAAH